MTHLFKSSFAALLFFSISCIYTFGQAPSNDLQANAISVGVASYCNGISGTQFDLTNATGSNGQIDVWYKFVANTTNFELSYPFTSSVKYEITSTQGSASVNGKLFSVSAVGKTYYIRFYTTGMTSLQQTFCLASSVTNDESYKSIAIADGACVSNSQAFRNATKSSGTFSCYAGTDYTDIWYSFTASAGSYKIKANTNTGLAFYAQVEDKNFNSIACGPGYVVSSIATATLNVTNLIPGDNYYIHVLKTNNNADYSMNVCATPVIAAPNLVIPAISNKKYGDLPFDITGTTSNNSDAITYSIISGNDYASITAGGKVTIKGAGQVTIQAKQAASAAFLEGTATTILTINKVNVIVKADDKSKTYGDANPALTLSYSGLINNDVPGIKFNEPVASTSVDLTTLPGTYSIDFANPIQVNDYEFIYQSGTLQVDSLNTTFNVTGNFSGREGSTIEFGVTSNNPSPISYSIIDFGYNVATLIDNTHISLISQGTYNLKIYVPGTSIYKSKTILKEITILPFKDNPNLRTAGYLSLNADLKPFFLTAESDSPGKITYSIEEKYQDGLEVTPEGLLTIKSDKGGIVTVDQEATETFYGQSTTIYLSISKVTPTITYTGEVTGYAGNYIKISGITNSQAPLKYSFDGYNVNGISADSIRLPGAGLRTLYVYTEVSPKFYGQYIAQQINVLETVAPVINDAAYNKIYGDEPFKLATESNSNGKFKYTFPENSVAEYSETTGLVTIKSTGAVIFQAAQAASGQYAAKTVNRYLIVNQKGLTVLIDSKTKDYNTENPPLTMNIIGFAYGENESVLTSIPVLSTTAVKTSDAGIYQIIKTVNGPEKNYFYTSSSNGTLTINKVKNVISYSGSTTVRVDSTVNLKVWSLGNDEFDYSISRTAGATIEGSGSGQTVNGNMSFKILDEGIVSVTFYSQWNKNYSSESRTIQITILPPLDAKIKFDDIMVANGTAPFKVNPTSTVTGLFNYQILSGYEFATITPEGLVTIIKPGTVIIEAIQTNSETGLKERALATLTITKKNPALTYSGQTKSSKGEEITLTASSLSSGAITYTLIPTSIATLNGSLLELNEDGNVEISITVAEDVDYMAQTITAVIHSESIATSISSKKRMYENAKIAPNPFTDHLTIDLQQMDLKTGTIALCDMQGNQIRIVADNELFAKQYYLDTQNIAAGMYILQIKTEDEIKTWKLIK